MLLIRAVMVAVKYGYRPRYLYAQSLKGAIPVEFTRSEELLFGWLPLRAGTARAQIEETCARVRVDVSLPLYFRNSLAEVRRALRLALFAFPEMGAQIRAVPRVRDGKQCGTAVRVPLHLWLLQLLLESSDAERDRFRAAHAGPRGRRGLLSALTRAAGASLNTVVRAVVTTLQVSLPYFILDREGEHAEPPLWDQSWRLKLIATCMIMGGFFVMFFFIVPLALVAVTQARRRLRWLRATGEIFCLEHFGDDELDEKYAAPGARHPRRRGAAALQLDFLSPSNILSWARAPAPQAPSAPLAPSQRTPRRRGCGRSVAVFLAGQLAFVLYASVSPSAGRAVPQVLLPPPPPPPPAFPPRLAIVALTAAEMFYVLCLLDLGFFGTCLVVCAFFAARCNQLVFQHRFFLSHLNMRLEEASQAGARALAVFTPPASLATARDTARRGPLARFRTLVPKAVASACPLCREPLIRCPCLRHIALCEKHIARDHRLHPETVVGVRADMNTLRVIASFTLSAFVFTFSRVRGLSRGLFDNIL
eukprot:tig00000498_g1624.t1